MNRPCDCCEGPRGLTPLPTANRSGLSQLRYRIGSHATFLQSMQARLSSTDYPELASLRTREGRDPGMALLDAWALIGDVLTFYQERIANEGYLRTASERRSVLDLARLIGYTLRPGVSASVYLAYTIDRDAAPVEIPAGARVNSIPGPGEQMQAFETSEPLTARHEWSAIKPRLSQPQTAASIADKGLYLEGTATNLKANDPLLVDLADGRGLQFVRIESVESDPVNERTRVQLRLGAASQADAAQLVKGIVTRFSDLPRFKVSADAAMTKRVLVLMQGLARVADDDPAGLDGHLATALRALEPELQAAREGHFTKLEPWVADLIGELRRVRSSLAGGLRLERAPAGNGDGKGEVGILGPLVGKLTLASSAPPASARQLPRDLTRVYGEKADVVPRLLASLQPALQKTLYVALKNLPPPTTPAIRVHALRIAAAPFGHNAPLRLAGLDRNHATFDEWKIADPWNEETHQDGDELNAETPAVRRDHHEPRKLYLDGDYDIAPDSFVVIDKPAAPPLIVPGPTSLTHRSLPAYGMSGKTVQIDLPAGQEWFRDARAESFATVRDTRVFAGSEPLTPARVPLTDVAVENGEIELGDLYEDLQPGRWLIVAGERRDVTGADGEPVAGLKAAELVMLAGVEQKVRQEQGQPLAADTVHTFITLATPLAYTYKRDTVTIYGNVVHATHGEAREEVLGSGDAAKPFQQFGLKQPPLTYVSAPTVSGLRSTLEVRVNEVQWHEVETLAALGPDDRELITRTDDDARTTVVFGNGDRGARLPTGQENVRAKYRNGIGRPGNVKAGQISLLNTRPLGVKEVVNPIRASGGADKEGRDQARKIAPLAALALDRLVSIQDYADFACRFAGVGKAAAMHVSDGRRQLVHVTIAGVDDVPIEPTSDLYRNLCAALHRYGDPSRAIGLAVRERLALVISSRVRIAADYRWDLVEPKIRAAILDAFSFDHVEPGQDLLLSDAITVVQRVPGVVYVDADVFDTISEAALLAGLSTPAAAHLELHDRLVINPARVRAGHRVAPAQLAYLTSEVPDTLILQELAP